MSLPTRLTTCFHEAGHAIVQLAHGSHPWIDSIAVEGLPDGILGLVDTPSIWQPSCLERAASRDIHEVWTRGAWRDVINYLAGPIAELRWRKHGLAAIWFAADEMARRCLTTSEESFTDFGRVRHRLEWAIPGDDHANFVKAWLETEEEVHRWWGPITKLARLLAERGRISDDELYPFWNGLRDHRSERRRPRDQQ
ncbi:hypothetical protein [Sphingomonas sp. 2SG]|uniref:hypothetical protein n=1 Tax=Sphingomonas sp. 2SG TaxID=2502201 RepID=UPI0010F77181|nr:hypothetical protein [Sphingomonas sp. 2SG]